MPTIEALREAFPHLAYVSEQTLTDPFFHVGVISSYLPDQARLHMSVEIVNEALRNAAVGGAS